MSGEGKVRGVHLTRILKYVRKRRGSDGIQKLVGRMNLRHHPEHPYREDSFQEKGWYPYSTYLDFLEEADALWGKGDGQLAYDIGLSTIKDMGILSFITRKPDLEELVQSAVKNYEQAYDFGRLESKRIAPNKLSVRYHGFPDRRVRCLYFAGSLQGTLEICGLRGTVKETRHADPGGFCEYTLTFERDG